MTRFVKLLLVATLAIAGTSGYAQSPASIASIASYDGADRQDKLVEGARREGTLTLYSTTPVDYMRAVINAFEKKYGGVKVNLWRSNSEGLLLRALNEARNATPSFDVIECISPPMETLHREGLLQAVKSPVLATLQPWAMPPHREWAATQLYLFVQAYNTKLVKKEDLPKTYDDLLDPKWKGKLSMEANDSEWFSAVIAQMGERKGVQFWRDLVSKNGVSVRTGHSLLNKLVGAGEVPLALTVYHSDPPTMKKQGAPIDWFAIEPAIAIANGVAVSRSAPHPNAAVLFYTFLLGEEGQRILATFGYVTSQKSIPSPFTARMEVLDPAALLDHQKESYDLFLDTVIKQSRN